MGGGFLNYYSIGQQVRKIRKARGHSFCYSVKSG